MKIYNYEEINNCIVYGSISNGLNAFMDSVKEKLPNRKSISNEVHPKELERQERLRIKKEREVLNRLGHMHYDMPSGGSLSSTFAKHMRNMHEPNGFNDTVIIVAGGCGIGGNEINTYLARFEEFNKVLADNNSYVLFVRGEKDDPQIFNEELINLSNVKTIPDYSIVQCKSFKCLCLGGSISLDREWKKQQEKRIGKKMYWDNEGFEYRKKEINEILTHHDIACIISNTCPSFSFPGTNSFNRSSWAKNDKTVLKEILNERKLMDKVYERIMENNKKPFVWFYSKYKVNNTNMLNDIVFQSLSKQECLSFNKIVSSNFGINFETNISYNQEIVNELAKKFGSFGSFLANNPWEDVDNNEAVEEVIEEEFNGEPIEEENEGNNFIDEIIEDEVGNGIAFDQNVLLNQVHAVDTETIAAADIQAPRIEYEPVRRGQMHFDAPNLGQLYHPNR